MTYNYKAYDEKNKTWIYGEREIIVNQSDLSKKYFIVNQHGKYEFKKENMCKLTPIRAGENLDPVYDKDIIMLTFVDSSPRMYIVKRGEGKLHLEHDDVTLYGLMLQDFDNNDYIFSDKVVNTPGVVQMVGNILENHLDEFKS